jgi:hypothetical protein
MIRRTDMIATLILAALALAEAMAFRLLND